MQVVSSTSNLQRGSFVASFLDESFSFTNIVNYSKSKGEEVYFLTRYCDYSNPDSTKKGKETSYPQGPLHIERSKKEMSTHIPKCEYKRTLNKPTTIATPNYSIVEDLSQTPCKMSSLEVLQSPPMQCNTLLSAIRTTDSSSHLTMNFDGNDVSFHIDVI